jgi:TonB family protein
LIPLKRPPALTFVASVLLHAAALAILWIIPSPDPPPVHSTRGSVTTLEFHGAAPEVTSLRDAVRQAAPDIPIQSRPPEPRVFRAPGFPSQVPLQKMILAEPPLFNATVVPTVFTPPPNLPPRILKIDNLADASTPRPSTVPASVSAPGAFGDASVASEPAPNKNAASGSFSAAEILFKPRPAYTEEARRIQLEGEVLLEIVLGASGDVRVSRVVRGLGHGLDETAMAAVREIRFQPARRNGAPVDSTAVVHIVFQLAY